MRARSLWMSVLVMALVASACVPVLRVTLDSEGGDASGASRDPVLSSDGGVVVFVSAADDLVEDDTNGADDVFARELGSGVTTLISRRPDGLPAAGPSTTADVSGDGQLVAFASLSDDLVVGDMNGVADVFVHDRVTGSTELVSLTPDGDAFSHASGSSSCWGDDCATVRRGVAISADGRYVAFVGPRPSGAGPAVLLHDRVASVTEVVREVPWDEVEAGVRFDDLALSGDGSVLAVTEVHLAPTGEPSRGLRLVTTDEMEATWVSPPTRGIRGVECCHPDLSADGRHVAFASPHPHLPEDDPPCGTGCGEDSDVFVYDRVAETYVRASASSTGSELDAGARAPSLSGDGRLVSWSMADAVLTDGITSDQSYLRDLSAGTITRISSGSAGPADAPVEASLSPDGRLVALQSAATTLSSDDVNGFADIFVRSPTFPLSSSHRLPVVAGATSTVSIEGTGLEPHTAISVQGPSIEIEDATWIDGSRIDVTVSVRPGASLGPRRLRLETPTAHGLTAASECECLEVTWTYPTADPDPERPNVVVILTDDQRWDTVDEMPATAARTDWARFSQSFVHEPQCCPARASFLTGRYSHHTGVDTLIDGADLDESITVATLLDDVGYRTGLFGRYLNGYPFGRGNYVPAGWDQFAAFRGATDYFGYSLAVNGALETFGTAEDDYATDRLAEMGRAFLRQTSPAEPFLLYLTPQSPHHQRSGFPPRPAPRHTAACPGRTFDIPPNYNQFDTVREPAWMAGTGPVALQSMAAHDLGTCRSLLSVDDMVSSILDELGRSGRLDDTYVVVTSDNGYGLGEHRLFGKGHLYEESIRVPLLVRGPSVVPGTNARLTSNVDLLPTILDWTGAEAPVGFVDGDSYAASIGPGGTVSDPTAVLLHGCRTTGASGGACGGYPQEMGHNWGLRTATHKYIEYPDGDVQLFDLSADPYELTNLADEPSQAALVLALHQELHTLLAG